MMKAAEDRRGNQLSGLTVGTGRTAPAEPVKLTSDYVGKRREYLLSFAADIAPVAWHARVITRLECNEFTRFVGISLAFGPKRYPLFVKGLRMDSQPNNTCSRPFLCRLLRVLITRQEFLRSEAGAKTWLD